MKPRALLLSILFLPLALAYLLADVPSTWSSGSNYTTGDLVIYNGTTYQVSQDVTNSTAAPDTSSAWGSLDAIAGDKQDPGTPPTEEIDTSGIPAAPDSNASDGNETGGGATAHTSGDFDGDGIPDILWQKDGTNEVRLWYMNADGSKKSEGTLTHSAGTVWKISSTSGDMNGDGKTDLLWQKEDGSTVFCYHMDGAGAIDYGKSVASGVASGWKFVAAADYNGDGKDDLLWHNTTKGSTVCWHLDGNGTVSGFSPLGSGIGANWNGYAGADFNGDGNGDVVYQNSTNGRVLVWHFDDKKNILSTERYVETMDTAWVVVGAKDYNTDGGVDLLIQHQTTGAVTVKYFKDGAIGEKEISTGNESSFWRIAN